MTATRPQPTTRGTAVLVAWAIALVAAWWLLRWSSRGALATPPIGSWAALGDWTHRRDQAELAIVAVRLAAQAMVLYLVFVSAAGALVRLSPAPRSMVLDRLTPGWLRGVLDTSLGFGLVATLGLVTLASPPTATPTPNSAAAIDERGAGVGPGVAPRVEGGDAKETSSSPAVLTALPDEPMVLAPLPPTSAAAAVVPRAPLPAASVIAPAERAVAHEVGAARIWVTRPGDHLWSIAAETVADDLDVEPTDRQIATYWRRLVEHNRSTLVDPENPDLILAGQTFALPPVSG